VPETTALNTEGYAGINSVSCASASNCSAGGYYSTELDDGEVVLAFVVNEINGKWQDAEEVPGASADADVTAASCTSAGNCVAAGEYDDSSAGGGLFVINEISGKWQDAEEVPGIAALSAGAGGAINSVSCASAGNCSAGGYYTTDSDTGEEAFVASEVNGTWQKATSVLGTGGYVEINSVSCALAGNCSAGGYYQAGPDTFEAFVVDETNGIWQKAIEVPGSATLNIDGYAGVTSVSCASASNCGAGGYYADGSAASQAFVVAKT
jgi:hypothetical protein